MVTVVYGPNGYLNKIVAEAGRDNANRVCFADLIRDYDSHKNDDWWRGHAMEADYCVAHAGDYVMLTENAVLSFGATCQYIATPLESSMFIIRQSQLLSHSAEYLT